MNWPQVFVLITFILGTAYVTVTKVKDVKVSSGTATLHIMSLLVWYAVFAYVLHAGGFW